MRSWEIGYRDVTTLGCCLVWVGVGFEGLIKFGVI